MNKTKRTLRERKFIEAYVENNGNATEAFLAINPKVKRKNASVYGLRMLEKVSIEIKEFLNRLGLDNLALSQKLKEGLEAVKKVSGFEVPDHNVRVRYLDMAFKLKASYPADKSKVEVTGKNGKPIGGTFVTLIEKRYLCPLREKGECPVEEKLKELEKSKSPLSKECGKED